MLFKCTVELICIYPQETNKKSYKSLPFYTFLISDSYCEIIILFKFVYCSGHRKPLNTHAASFCVFSTAAVNWQPPSALQVWLVFICQWRFAERVCSRSVTPRSTLIQLHVNTCELSSNYSRLPSWPQNSSLKHLLSVKYRKSITQDGARCLWRAVSSVSLCVVFKLHRFYYNSLDRHRNCVSFQWMLRRNNCGKVVSANAKAVVIFVVYLFT